MLRLRLRLRCRDGGSTGMQGTAAAGEPGARRAAAVEAPGHAGREGRGGGRMRSVFANSSPV